MNPLGSTANSFVDAARLAGPAKPPAFAANKPPAADAEPATPDARVESAKELKQAFTQFVGETFYGQMLKTMRESVGEPAYFHGGMAERQFQSQLDAHVAQDLAGHGAGGLADDLFRSQFPDEAGLLDQAAKQASADAPSLGSLDALRRL